MGVVVGLSVSIVAVEVTAAASAADVSSGCGAAKLVVGGVVADVVSMVVVLDMELKLSIYAVEPSYNSRGVMVVASASNQTQQKQPQSSGGHSTRFDMNQKHKGTTTHAKPPNVTGRRTG